MTQPKRRKKRVSEAHKRHKRNRALSAMTVGATADREKLRAADRLISPGQYIAQFQMPIAGLAGKSIVSSDISVQFRVPFLTRIQNSGTDLVNPTFSFGLEMTSDVDVIITAHLKSWQVDSMSIITGATVTYKAHVPNAPKKQRFNAVAHLSFMGFAAPNDDTEDDLGDDTGAT